MSKKLKNVIFQHKPFDGVNMFSGMFHDNSDLNFAKFKDKMVVDLKSQIQEDIHELSSEDEQ